MEIWTVCRLCLNSNNNPLKSLPEVTYNTIPFLNIYFELVGISFTDYPTFPARVCPTCETELIEAYRFREKCLETEGKLKDLEGQESPAASIEFIPTVPATVLDACPENKIKLEIEDVEIIPDDQPIIIPERPMKKEAYQNHAIPLGVKNKPIQCKRCADIFKGLDLFKKHKCCKSENKSQVNPKHPKRLQKSQKPAKVYECKECQKIFRTQQCHMTHMDKHKNKKRYECNDCDKKFFHWLQRRNHIYKVHLKTAFCECEHCGKGFYKIYDLKKHINVEHLKVISHQCEVCGKTFKHKNTLCRHMTTHTQSENMKCKICGKILKNRKSLQQHSRVHSDKKNYICPVCSKGFTWNITLKSHVRRLHPDKVHLLPPDGTIVNKGYLQKMAEYGT